MKKEIFIFTCILNLVSFCIFTQPEKPSYNEYQFFGYNNGADALKDMVELYTTQRDTKYSVYSVAQFMKNNPNADRTVLIDKKLEFERLFWNKILPYHFFNANPTEQVESFFVLFPEEQDMKHFITSRKDTTKSVQDLWQEYCEPSFSYKKYNLTNIIDYRHQLLELMKPHALQEVKNRFDRIYNSVSGNTKSLFYRIYNSVFGNTRSLYNKIHNSVSGNTKSNTSENLITALELAALLT